MFQETVNHPRGASVLDTIERSHPRLILKDIDLAKLKAGIESDPLLRQCADAMMKRADDICDKPPLAYEITDYHILFVSQECLNRIYTLGLAWRLTGEARYAVKAKENLLAVCAFEDWHPVHFLDTAEMCHAVGIGYDWFFHELDPATRQRIKDALIRHALSHGAVAYGPGRPAAWVEFDHNWNQVCNGGMLIGALAIAESDPDYARTIVPGAVRSLPKAMAAYDPDGAIGEGPGYWGYATSYTTYALCALETALGTDFGLGELPGFSETGWFPIHMTGPAGLPFNFADTWESRPRQETPCLFWLARRFSNSAFAEAERALLDKYPGNPLDIIWYIPPEGKKSEAVPLDKLFRGRTEVAVFRSAWDDPDAVFVGVKAGCPQVNHAQLDLGTFVLDASGVRWARDLGFDRYALPGYFDKERQDGRRWTYYRNASHSHSVPLLNNQNQNVFAEAGLLDFGTTTERAWAVLDLTSAYGHPATKVRREVALIDRSRVLVQDDFELEAPCEITWGMTTGAEIALAGRQAVLREAGKELRAEVLSPVGATFSVESAERRPPENENTGIRRLTVRLQNQKGRVRVAVLLVCGS